MLIIQIITIATIAIGLLLTYIILKNKGIAIPNTAYKIVSGVLAVAFFVRYMWDREAYLSILQLDNSPLASPALTAISLVLYWCINAVVLLVIMYPIYRGSRLATIVKYFGSIVTVLSIVFARELSIGQFGMEAYGSFNIRTLMFGIELGILIAYCAVVLWDNGKLAVSKQDAKALWLIIPMLLVSMPTYMPSALFGYASFAMSIKELSIAHRLLVYGSLVLPLVIHALLRNKSDKTIRGVLTYICLATLITFSTHNKLPSFAHLYNWPLHLCNTAMYIIPLCLIFRLKKVFYFTYFINVMGAFLAILMPNYSDASNIISSTVISFFINHYIAFFMPILMVSLRVYERPRLREFRYSMVGFGVYFVIALIANVYCSNFATVDFFFLNSDFIVDKLGTWAENMMLVVWEFELHGLQFVFYPLYQAVFFAVYVGFGLGIWFLYEGSYTFFDTLYDIECRNKAIKLDRLALASQLADSNKEEPMNKDILDSVVLQDFSKRYGSSKVYAVKNANLTVSAGQIFGFLGHNGAGKSTIIKSIVGIQPITSGAISVCGYDVDKQSVMAKRSIGFVPDHYALYEKLTGREYLNYIADLYEVSTQDRDMRIDHYVQLFHLEGAIDNQIKTYSHGMKQKVTIMSALVHNPKVWILDEPLTGLDPDSIYQVKECMRQHAEKGNIVFFSSHLIDIVETVCSHVAIIAKGNILCQGRVDELSNGTRLEEYYRMVTQQATNTEIDMQGNLVDSLLQEGANV